MCTVMHMLTVLPLEVTWKYHKNFTEMSLKVQNGCGAVRVEWGACRLFQQVSKFTQARNDPECSTCANGELPVLHFYL